jgi:signal transduction histidine kinase
MSDATTEDASSSSSRSKPPPVLVVDDYAPNLIAIEAILSDLRCRMVTARSGAEALQRIQEGAYAGVLMDIRMPGLDGFATASFMRQRAESSETPIIFITGEDIDRSRLDQAYGLGAVDFLVKPFDPQVLRSKVALFAELFRLRGQARALRKSREEELLGLRTREEWLAMVAHDLRQPLVATSLSVAALLRNSSKVEVERMRRHYAIIQRAVIHMERMVGDLLDVARLESGTFAVEIAPCSMADILFQAAELLSPIAMERDIQLEIAHLTAPCVVRCERDRILQVLSNLVGNAIKFTSPGGRIVVGCDIAPQEVVVFVRDTGPGIPEEHVSQVFDKYWRGKRSGEGLGLGLPIVRSIISAHGGRVWLESAVGRGSTFYFSLPLVRDAQAVGN